MSRVSTSTLRPLLGPVWVLKPTRVLVLAAVLVLLPLLPGCCCPDGAAVCEACACSGMCCDGGLDGGLDGGRRAIPSTFKSSRAGSVFSPAGSVVSLLYCMWSSVRLVRVVSVCGRCVSWLSLRRSSRRHTSWEACTHTHTCAHTHAHTHGPLGLPRERSSQNTRHTNKHTSP